LVRSAKPFQPKLNIAKPRPREIRGNRHERGYDYEWTQTSKAHLNRFPLCEECIYEGRTVLADLVDHKIPLRLRPDLRLKKSNLWSLCQRCHDTVKRAMEGIAEGQRCVDDLTKWCDEPTSRPAPLRPRGGGAPAREVRR
jgi:hypothetical protein